MSRLAPVNGPFETAIREWPDPGVQQIANELLRVQDLKLISTLYAYEAGGANPAWSFCALLKAILRCRPNVGDSLSSIPSINLYPWAVGLSQWGLHRIDHDHEGRKDLVEKMAVGVLHRLCGPCQCHDALGQSEAPRLISSRVDTASDKDTTARRIDEVSILRKQALLLTRRLRNKTRYASAETTEPDFYKKALRLKLTRIQETLDKMEVGLQYLGVEEDSSDGSVSTRYPRRRRVACRSL